jgi:geranylgeranyl diphosphate synthase type II
VNELRVLQQAIENGLSALGLEKEPKSLYEPADYILSLGGKRLRPVLALLACSLYADPNKAINQALAVEVFHNFTLVHDDIMDEAPLRRGRETVHKKWSLNTAILSGDVMLIKAYQLLANCEASLLPKLLEAFNKMAVEVCEGQQMDMDFETRDNVEEEEYIRMIQLKTSVLLGCSLKMGALVGGASEEDAENLYQFGLKLGTSFQIKDDWLDCFGDPEKFGKQVGGDIIANKKTLLLIKALKKAEGEDEVELKTWLAGSQQKAEEKVNAVKALYKKLGVDEFAKSEIDRFYQDARTHLGALSISTEAKKPLYTFARWLYERES